MKKNYALYDATAHIDEDILNDVINSSKKTAKKPVWRKLVAVAACICLLLGIGLPIFNNNNKAPVTAPLGIYACAMNEDGLSRQVLNKDEGIKLKKIELGNGFDGFMFAVELEDKNQMSEVHYLTYKTFPEKPNEEIYALMNEKGLRYFYFIPDPALDKDGFVESFAVTVTSQETGAAVEYGLLLERDASEYTVTLTSLKSFPDGAPKT